jgi:hypothetical protein
MLLPSRDLEFEKMEHRQPIFARCSLCRRHFQVTPKPGERTDDLLLRVRAGSAKYCEAVPFTLRPDFDLVIG